MDPLIQKLVAVQQLDLERTRLGAELSALPAQIQNGEADLAAAQASELQATQSLATEESLRKRLDGEIQRRREQAARLRAQLDEATTQPHAQHLEHEIQFAVAEADRLETEAFASLERTELQTSALAEARRLAAEETEALEKIRARCSERSHQYAKELAALTEQRDELRMAVLLADAALLDRFDRIAKKSRGQGLARVENQQCLGCRMAVRLQLWNELREGALHACDNCGRLLYWDPAIFAGAHEERSR